MGAMEIKYKVDMHAYAPERAHPDDAGYDLRSPVTTGIGPGESITIDIGVHIEIPRGYYGKIEGRSGLAIRNDVEAFGGVIDCGYTGSIAVKLRNYGSETFRISPGDKIAQLIILPYLRDAELVEVAELDDTPRGNGGFGSTGR